MSCRSNYLFALELIRSGVTNSRAIALRIPANLSITETILNDLVRDDLIQQTRWNANSLSYAAI